MNSFAMLKSMVRLFLLFLMMNSLAEAQGCKRSLIEILYKRGIPDNKRSLGFHGTSLDALILAAETGVIPTGVGRGNEEYIYFYPNTESPQMQKASPKLFGKTIDNLPFQYLSTPNAAGKRTALTAFKDARDYAEVNAGLMYLTQKFKTKTKNQLHRLKDELEDFSGGNRETTALLKKGFSRDQLWEIYREFTKITHGEKGISIVLSLDPKILADFKVETAVGPDSGLRVHAPHGIPLKYISGIEVIAAHDSKHFEDFESWLKTQRLK